MIQSVQHATIKPKTQMMSAGQSHGHGLRPWCEGPGLGSAGSTSNVHSISYDRQAPQLWCAGLGRGGGRAQTVDPPPRRRAVGSAFGGAATGFAAAEAPAGEFAAPPEAAGASAAGSAEEPEAEKAEAEAEAKT